MNSLKIHGIQRVNANRLEYSYSVEGDWAKYFELSDPMWVEYSQPVKEVPDSVAVLPLIGNVLVLASLMDAEILVNEIDADFYACVEDVIGGFEKVMPRHVHFKKTQLIRAEKIVKNEPVKEETAENLLFFSGGVDATSSLINHLEEKPALVTIWGADIPWNQKEAWDQAISFNREVAERYALSLLEIRTNIRTSLQDVEVNDFTVKLVNDWWWPTFHHSLAMMGVSAPLAYSKSKKLYIGSSYCAKDKVEWGTYVLASDPKIDNHVKFCGCQVVHDGYEYSRYDKIEGICRFYEKEEKKPFLRVCYRANTGENCGICEKCSLTMMAIVLAGANPKDYGFAYDEEKLPMYFAMAVQEKIRNKNKYSFMSQYSDVHSAYKKVYKLENVPSVLRAFYEADPEHLYDFMHASGIQCVKKDDGAAILREEKEELQKQIDSLWLEIEKYKVHNQALQEHVHAMQQSNSWKLTKPVRAVGRIVKGKRKTMNKETMKEKIYEIGLQKIRKKYPEGNWKHEYMKWRWWFICSDHYETRFRPMFDKMLKSYEGELFNRGKLIKLDYWLCWIFLGAEPDDYFDFEFFKKGWTWRNHHITKQRLNFFVPLFNGSEGKMVLNDKCQFNKNWKDYIKRKWCIPQNVTFEEFQQLFGNLDKIIIKPLALFGGKGIRVIDLNNDNFKNVYEELHLVEDAMIVEEFVHQKGYLNEVYPSALNPLRVCTIRVEDAVEVCYAFFTAGCQGTQISNDCSGGICFPINTETGKMGIGQGKKSNGHHKHPDTGVMVEGNFVPHWERVKEFACEAHRLAPKDIHLIGWDVCVSGEELSLVEGNNGPGFPELPDKKVDMWEKIQEYLDQL